MGSGAPLTVDLLALAVLVVGTPAAGAAAGFVLDAALQLRHLHRTGHVRDCPGLRGWPCPCRDSAPRQGTLDARDRRGSAAAGVFVLPDAGPPPARDRVRVPGLRSGRRVDTSPTQH